MSYLSHGKLEEARSDRAERLRVRGAEEAIFAAAVLGPLEPALAQRDLHLIRDRLPGAHDLDGATEAPLEHRSDERIVRAPEDHRVDVRLPQRIAIRLDLSDDPVVDLST